MRKVPYTFLLGARIEVDQRDLLGRKHLRQRASWPNVEAQVTVFAAEEIRAEEPVALRVINIAQDFCVDILAFEGKKILDEAARALGAESNALMKIAEHIPRARLFPSKLGLAFDFFKGVVGETKCYRCVCGILRRRSYPP